MITSSEPVLLEIKRRVEIACGSTPALVGKDAPHGRVKPPAATAKIEVRTGRSPDNLTFDGSFDTYHRIRVIISAETSARADAVAVDAASRLHDQVDDIAAAANDGRLVGLHLVSDAYPANDVTQGERGETRHSVQFELEMTRRQRAAHHAPTSTP